MLTSARARPPAASAGTSLCSASKRDLLPPVANMSASLTFALTSALTSALCIASQSGKK